MRFWDTSALVPLLLEQEQVHALKAADALQLAAARLWSGEADGSELVTFDERLRLAARLEGFKVLPDA